jgi:hypothetical protein
LTYPGDTVFLTITLHAWWKSTSYSSYCGTYHHVVFIGLTDSHVLQRLYDFVFFKVTSFFQENDLKFSQAASKLTYLDLRQLGLWNDLGINIDSALVEFNQLQSRRTPLEKLECLIASTRLLTKEIEPFPGSLIRPKGISCIHSVELRDTI